MIYLREAKARGRNINDWLESYHTFSFADYDDLNFMGFATLRVINEDYIQPGKGFDKHSHKNMEILSYVLEGAIEHHDSMGHEQQIKAGDFQIMSAGTGVHHSEHNPLQDEILHLYQIWILPEKERLKPRYETRNFTQNTAKQLILSPDAREGSLKVFQDMQLWRWYLEPDERQQYLIPEKHDKVWIQVIAGEIIVNSIHANTSDGIAIAEEQTIMIEAVKPSEILVFELS